MVTRKTAVPPVPPVSVMPSAEPLAVDVRVASRRLGIGETLTRRLVGSGELASFRLGRRLLIPVAALDQLVAEASTVGITGSQI